MPIISEVSGGMWLIRIWPHPLKYVAPSLREEEIRTSSCQVVFLGHPTRDDVIAFGKRDSFQQRYGDAAEVLRNVPEDKWPEWGTAGRIDITDEGNKVVGYYIITQLASRIPLEEPIGVSSEVVAAIAAQANMEE